MRRAMIGSVLIAAAGLVGAAVLYGSVFHEVPLAKGALFEALVEASEGGEDNLTEVFAPFVAADGPLEDRVPPLLANGFRCDMRPAMRSRQSSTPTRRLSARPGGADVSARSGFL